MQQNEFGHNSLLQLFNLYLLKESPKQNAVDSVGNMIPEMFGYLHFYHFIVKLIAI